MKKIISTLVSSVVLAAPAMASPLGGALPTINAVSTNQATNNQTASGSVYQSPVGGVNSNYQINNSQSTDYGFAPGIYCRGANFSIGGYGGGVNNNSYGGVDANSSDYGAIAMFTIPIGGSVQDSCKSLAKEIVKQRQLDTAYNMIKVCGAMKKENIAVDYSVFPDFKICDAVTIRNLSVVPNLSRDPFSPKDNTTVTIPVK